MSTRDKLASRNQSERTAQINGNGRDTSFADLLEEYEPQPMQRGQFISGEVLQIDYNVILADVAAKRTAVVPPHDLAEVEDDIIDQISVGDEVTLCVLRTPRGDEELLVSLNKGLEQADWHRATDLLENEEPIELEVVGYNKGGLLVDFGYLKGFVPASHVPQLQGAHDRQAILSRKTELVGGDLLLKVIEVDRQRRRLILSAKKAQSERRRQRLRELKQREGETITGCVTNLVSFGAFVDLDGVEGLIHVSEIGWEKVEDPAKYLRRGEEVETVIQSVELERERISLSRKALLPSPWEAYAQEHAPGDLAEGVVTSVTDFGAFVGVAEGIEGLIHTTEMHGTQDFTPEDLLFPGDQLLVRIINIEPQRQRLALSQRRISQKEEIEWIQRKQDTEPERALADEAS